MNRRPEGAVYFVSCFAIAMLVALWVPPSARAQPLDISNLAVRPILIEAPGFAVQLPGTYGPGGPSEGEVQISGAEYERYLDEVGDSPAGVPVPGSFSDVVLTVDLSSLSVAAAPIEGQVDIMVGPLADLVRTLGTERTAGYQVVQVAPGVFFTIFCDGPTEFGPCEIVPGEPFDPVTGEFKMVGDDTLSHPDITDPRFATYFASNTLRVLEVPTSVPSLGLLGRVALAALLVGLSRRHRASAGHIAFLSRQRRPWLFVFCRHGVAASSPVLCSRFPKRRRALGSEGLCAPEPHEPRVAHA